MHEAYTPLELKIEPLNALAADFLRNLARGAVVCRGFSATGSHVTLTLGAYVVENGSREHPDSPDQPNGHHDDVPGADFRYVEGGVPSFPIRVSAAPELPSLADTAAIDDPVRRAVGRLLSDQATKTVTECLILPLIEMRLRGDAMAALSRISRKFCDQPKSKLEFAFAHLHKGKHELFPDNEEIYAAIGRYRPKARVADEVPAHANGGVL